MRRVHAQSEAVQSGRDTCKDVGTLWSMRRNGRSARCTLLAWSGTLELRVLVDGQSLLSERCDRAAEAFTLAEAWKRRMIDKGWHQVIPAAEQPTAADG